MANRSRREFLEDSLLGAAAVLMAGAASPLLAEEKQSTSPNEKLSVALVGVRGRGGEHLAAWTKRDDAEVTYICDVDSKVGNQRAEDVEKKTGRKPKVVEDLRQMLEDKSVDVVSIATPNHWHALAAIWSLQAGKDVYVEKPVSHNVSEGRRIVETARKYNKICQTGTQCRTMAGMRDAIAFVQGGGIGEVKLARGLCYKRRGSIGPLGNYTPPQTVNYDLWLGPAPNKPLTRPQLHYDWHWQWDYGNGDLGNQGIHQMDIARWGLGVDSLSQSVLSYGGRFGYEDAGETANTQIVVHDYGPKTLVFEVRGLPTQELLGCNVGVIFYGSDGYVALPRYDGGAAFGKDGSQLKTFKGEGDHFANFVKAVRSRKFEDLNADILQGHLSSALCHLGNISYRLGEKLSVPTTLERLKALKTTDDGADTLDRTTRHLADNKVDNVQMNLGAHLTLDAPAEKFKGNDQADAMLTRQYRAPFIVPAAGKV